MAAKGYKIEVPVEETAPIVAPAGTVDYVCGLRKVGPSKYVLVKGKLVDGVPDITVDEPHLAQDLGLSAEVLRLEFQRLMGQIP